MKKLIMLVVLLGMPLSVAPFTVSQTLAEVGAGIDRGARPAITNVVVCGLFAIWLGDSAARWDQYIDMSVALGLASFWWSKKSGVSGQETMDESGFEWLARFGTHCVLPACLLVQIAHAARTAQARPCCILM